MKRKVSAILTLALLLSLCAPVARAEEPTTEDSEAVTLQETPEERKPAPAPEDLQWDFSYYYDYSDNCDVAYSSPGTMSWLAPDGDWSFWVNLYRVEETETGETADWAYNGAWYISISADADSRYCTVDFRIYDETISSGTYYFTVKTLGDGVNYADSDPVQSKTWKYTKPELQLNVSQPVFDPQNYTITWTNLFDDKDETLVDTYMITVYKMTEYEEDGQTEQSWCEDMGFGYWPDVLTQGENGTRTLSLPSWVLRDLSVGEYAFTVTAYSNDLTQAQNGEPSEMSKPFPYTPPETPAPAPEDLQWDFCYYYDYSDNCDVADSSPGTMSWLAPDGDWSYRVDLYRVDEGTAGETEVWVDYWDVDISADTNIRHCTFDFPFDDDLPSGEYYFTVQTYGDGVNYADSAEVTSGCWTWNNPGLRLNTTNAAWGDGGAVTWTNEFSDDSLVDTYWIEVWQADGQTGWYPKTGFSCQPDELVKGENGARAVTLPNWIRRQLGAGEYAFTVTAFSKDQTQALNGETSEMSGSRYFDALPADADPTELAWGISYDRDTGEKSSVPGAISWRVTGDSTSFEIKVFQVGEEKPIYEITWYLWNPAQQTDGYCSFDNLLNWEDLPYGTYYFTVQSLGGDDTGPSEIVTSTDTWTFTQPDIKLNVSTPTWGTDGLDPSWTLTDPKADPSMVEYYMISLYKSETETGELVWVDSSWYSPIVSSYYWGFSYRMQEYGDGYYAYTVQAYSADRTQAMNGDASLMSERYYYEAPTKLDDPKGLTWEEEPDGTPGCIGWLWGSDDVSYYHVELYKVGEDWPIMSMGFGSKDMTEGDYFSCSPLSMYIADNGPGDYYFTVQAIGDGVTYRDSDPVTSKTWRYDAPPTQLSQVTGLNWTWETLTYEDCPSETVPCMNWDALASAYEVYGYQVQYYYAASPDGEKEIIGNAQTNVTQEILRPWRGSGYYFFRVRALSDDITKVGYGAWSEYSPAFAYTYTATAADWYQLARVEDGVKAILSLNLTEDAASAFCAVYDKAGRQIGVTQLTLTSDAQTVWIPCDSSEAATIKAFLLDQNSAPVCPAGETTFSGS
jgi:hypothetical protein